MMFELYTAVWQITMDKLLLWNMMMFELYAEVWWLFWVGSCCSVLMIDPVHLWGVILSLSEICLVVVSGVYQGCIAVVLAFWVLWRVVLWLCLQSILQSFQVCVGPFVGLSWVSLGTVSGLSWGVLVCLGSVTVLSWGCLKSVWVYLWSVLELSQVCLGAVLGLSWSCVRSVLNCL